MAAPTVIPLYFLTSQGIGNGAVAQASLGSFVGGPAVTFQSINVGYALALVIGVYVSAGVSGGHLNPAVTFAMALLGNTSWLMVMMPV